MNVSLKNRGEVLSKGLERFANILHNLTTTTDVLSILETFIEDIVGIIEVVDASAILLWDPVTELLQPFAAFGYEEQSFLSIRLRPGEGLPGKAFEEGEIRICETSEACTAEMADLNTANRTKWFASNPIQPAPKALLAIPISGFGKHYGVLVLEIREDPHQFSQQDQAYAQIFADVIALTVERKNPGFTEDSHPHYHGQHHLEMEWVETISHELRLPLTAIKGYATALLLEEVDWSLTKRQEFLEMIEEECDQMESLLGDLLNAALVDVSQLPLEMHRVSLPEIARDVSEEMERRTDKHRILFDFPENFPFVEGDVRWIKQVFRNLFDNAVKYSPDGGLIYIHGEVRTADVVVKISDPGIGILPEDLIPLFERQIHTKALTDFKLYSSGLGLPITRTIVEAHGGRIWAQSKVGQGTTMSFSLPFIEDDIANRR